MTPTAVVFDLGKVLLDFDYRIALRRLRPWLRADLTEGNGLLSGLPVLLEYECGQLTTEEFFERIRGVLGFTGTLAEFAPAFGDIFTEIAPMVAVHAEMRRRGVATYIFSNTNELAIRHVRRQFPFFAGFAGYILSYEQRVMKPDAAIYEALERLSGRHGAELFYLDDRPENVAAGWARGWQGVVHETPAASRAALVQAGVLA
ncbi:MAG: HAD family phosphatase [Verrucomicrobiota bacterium]|jgi:FMN phosphatase YigB (HAD superfamily)